MLGLGLGLNKGSYIKPLPKYLTDARCTFAINVDRQVKALANPNSPFINPLVDVVGKLGKNLVDVFALGNAYVNTAYVSNKIRFNALNNNANTSPYFKNRDFKLNTRYTISGIWSQPSNNNYRFRFAYTDGTFDNQSANPPATPTAFSFTSAEGKTIDYIAIWYSTVTGVNYTEIENLQLEENSVATTYEPYGFNNVLLQSFAGTTADGYTQIALPNGKNPWFLKFDGTDSLGIMANTADMDILGTNDFAISTVFRTPAALVTSFLLCKGVGEATQDNEQISIYFVSNKMYLRVGGVLISTNLDILNNTDYVILITRIAGTLKVKCNAFNYTIANSTSMVSTPLFRIGTKATNAGGTAHTSLFNGNLGNLAIFYNGATGLDIAKVEKAVAKLNANYI